MREKFAIDAAYFHGDIPVVYFKGLESASDDDLAKLHRNLWNHNRAPLLIAVLPDEVRVYNCFAPPIQQGKLGFDDSTILATARHATDVAALRHQLGSYSRQEVESGRLARTREGEFRRDHRAHQRLLDNLSHVRGKLLGKGLGDHVVNNLIGRSIFVRYLEDRGVLDHRFFHDYAAATSYTDILQRSREETYRLFAFLARKFNGDMFPVDDTETQSVALPHLQLLGSFLSGTEMASGQMYFWAYDFKYIPIELISSIYEEFLHTQRAETGAYYTPPEIVDFVLNEVLPWDGHAIETRVLDPACGSGIFLVEAYRRLIERRREIVRHPDIWKIAMWGSARDIALIQDLRRRFPSLKAVAESRGWTMSQGAQIGGGEKHYVPELNSISFVPAQGLLPGRVISTADQRIGSTVFHRPRALGVYRAPHVLIRRGVLVGGRIAAAFLPYDAVFTDAVFGIAGPETDTQDLKALCAYLNSSLACYYHFLTSASWGVERDEIKPNEHLMLPCALELEETGAVTQLVSIIDRAQDAPSQAMWQRALDDAVFQAYQLTPAEQHLVLDTVEVAIDMFSRGLQSHAFAEPATNDLMAYAAAFTEVINGAIRSSGDAFAATVYEGSSPYRAVEFTLAQRGVGLGSSRLDSSPRLDSALSNMAALLLEEHSQRLYLRRNVKAFGPENIHILKPAERRYWTRTAAYNDADEMVAHLMRQLQPA